MRNSEYYASVVI